MLEPRKSPMGCLPHRRFAAANQRRMQHFIIENQQTAKNKRSGKETRQAGSENRAAKRKHRGKVQAGFPCRNRSASEAMKPRMILTPDS